MAEKKSLSQRVGDTLQNLVSMLGTSVDKSTYNEFVFSPMDRGQLEAAYRGDWVARKVVNIPAQDATREWREWKADEKQIDLLEKTEKRLHLQSKLRVAMTKARLYGGGGLILGFGDGRHDQPLDPESVKKDGLKFVHAFAKHEVTCGQPDGDVNGPNYGLPSEYTLNSVNATVGGSMIKVHPSRVVRLCGAEVPDRTLTADGWADSVLEALLDAVKNVASSSSSVAALLQECKIDVVKIPGFMEGMQSSDYKNKIIERFSLVNRAKSTVNTLLLDKEEEWERITASFAGIPELMKLYLLIASGAADIPATRLLSQSAQGLNATGEGDLRNYYDHVRSVQTNELSPAMEMLDEIVIRTALGSRPEEIWYDWRPLWQMTPKERADVAKVKADTVKVLVDTSLVDPAVLGEGVKNMLIDDGTLPGMEQAYEEYEASGEGVDENDPNVREQFNQLKADPSSAAPSGSARGQAGGRSPSPSPGRPPLRIVSSDSVTEALLRSIVRQVIDEFSEEKIERDKDGKFSSGGGGGDSKPSAEKLLAAPVKGGSSERVAMRAALKTATGEQKHALQGKILQSFKVDYDKAVKVGNGKKAAELQAKSAQYSKSYGKPDPIASNMTTAQASSGYSQKEVAAGKELMKENPAPSGSKYSPAEVQAFNDLAALTSENSAKQYIAQGKHGLTKELEAKGLTAAHAGHIAAYTGSQYKATNAALRQGAMTEKQWNHVSQLNNALDKLPDYKGTVYRKADLGPNQFKLYTPGLIVEERAFTSTSTSKGTWSGSYQYVIKSETGKDVKPFSLHKNENEVLFRSGTRFKVTAVKGNEIHMEEVRGR